MERSALRHGAPLHRSIKAGPSGTPPTDTCNKRCDCGVQGRFTLLELLKDIYRTGRTLAQNGMPILSQSGREGLQQFPKAQDDDHDAHQDHQRAIRETAGHIGRKGRCQHPTKDQPSDDRPEIQADGEDEGC
jgi:hypothetical protein